MPYPLTPVVLLVAALHAANARADEPGPSMFSLSGFGTLGLVHSSEDKADFTSTPFKPNGAGYSRTWSGDVDSLIGVQVGANLTQQLSAVMQVISEQNYDNSYRPQVKWANVKYQITPDFSIRLGRTALPIFMVSESRKIGYANPWVRPPVEVYSLVPVTGNNGVDASYRLHLGAATDTFQVTAGRANARFPSSPAFGALSVQSRDQLAFANTLEQGFTTLRVNYGQARVTVPELRPLFAALRQFGPQGAALADKYSVERRLVSFVGIGASYDPGPWFIMGEWGHVDTRSVLGERTGAYATAGYRFGGFTPYLTYARTRVGGNISSPGLDTSALPPALAGPATGLNAALNAILGAQPVQNTLSVGGRWDVIRNTSLSLQLDHSRIGAGSPGPLTNTQPGFKPGGKLTVFSAALDFVF